MLDIDVTEVARLREENALLRRAALTFGGLAERLHTELQRERQAAQRRALRHEPE
jgi:hypothetical protein